MDTGVEQCLIAQVPLLKYVNVLLKPSNTAFFLAAFISFSGLQNQTAFKSQTTVIKDKFHIRPPHSHIDS